MENIPVYKFFLIVCFCPMIKISTVFFISTSLTVPHPFFIWTSITTCFPLSLFSPEPLQWFYPPLLALWPCMFLVSYLTVCHDVHIFLFSVLTMSSNLKQNKTPQLFQSSEKFCSLSDAAVVLLLLNGQRIAPREQSSVDKFILYCPELFVIDMYTTKCVKLNGKLSMWNQLSL